MHEGVDGASLGSPSEPNLPALLAIVSDAEFLSMRVYRANGRHGSDEQPDVAEVMGYLTEMAGFMHRLAKVMIE